MSAIQSKETQLEGVRFEGVRTKKVDHTRILKIEVPKYNLDALRNTRKYSRCRRKHNHLTPTHRLLPE